MSGFGIPAAVLTGAVAGAGLFLLVLAVAGIARRDPGKPSMLRRSWHTPAQRTVMLATGVATGLVVLATTRLVVLAAGIGVLAAFWGAVFGGAAGERAAILRLEALASWTESLRDSIAGAIGLEQAIAVTTPAAGAPLRPALNRLTDRLRIREPMPQALMRFAEDVDDPSADLIIAALVLNARLRGPGLRDVLTALATSAREELDMRRRVEAARRSTRRSVRIVIGVTLGVAGMLVLFNRSYVAPYQSLVGELVLALAVALFAGGVLWLRSLARIETPERFLVSAGPGRAIADGLGPAMGEVVTGGAR